MSWRACLVSGHRFSRHPEVFPSRFLQAASQLCPSAPFIHGMSASANVTVVVVVVGGPTSFQFAILRQYCFAAALHHQPFFCSNNCLLLKRSGSSAVAAHLPITLS